MLARTGVAFQGRRFESNRADWKEQCRQNRELRREQIREQRRRDENWERRRPWMMAIAPYLRGEVTDAPIQMVFDIDGLIEFITSFL